jgi:hypothetical protein
VADHMVLVGSAVAAMHVAEGAGAPLIEKVRFAADSPLEEEGFEPSVPGREGIFQSCPVRAFRACFSVRGRASSYRIRASSNAFPPPFQGSRAVGKATGPP